MSDKIIKKCGNKIVIPVTITKARKFASRQDLYELTKDLKTKDDKISFCLASEVDCIDKSQKMGFYITIKCISLYPDIQLIIDEVIIKDGKVTKMEYGKSYTYDNKKPSVIIDLLEELIDKPVPSTILNFKPKDDEDIKIPKRSSYYSDGKSTGSFSSWDKRKNNND